MNESSPSLPHPKIHRHHQERLAVVYVRQSTPQQMTRHPESTRLQYGLVDRYRASEFSPAAMAGAGVR